ncbi:hypothetical protein HUW46_09308 [Amycolatopsis sp. CA-230715]|nr:hypothetical protein HUW46_09308 [Amycolatopsis sp. CA-230715]
MTSNPTDTAATHQARLERNSSMRRTVVLRRQRKLATSLTLYHLNHPKEFGLAGAFKLARARHENDQLSSCTRLSHLARTRPPTRPQRNPGGPADAGSRRSQARRRTPRRAATRSAGLTARLGTGKPISARTATARRSLVSRRPVGPDTSRPSGETGNDGSEFAPAADRDRIRPIVHAAQTGDAFAPAAQPGGEPVAVLFKIAVAKADLRIADSPTLCRTRQVAPR